MADNNNSNPLQPPPGNNQNKSPFFLVLFVLLFAAVKVGALFLLPRSPAVASDLTIENILNSVNSERGQRNLATLNTNAMLSSAAQSKSDDMVARHYFAHVDPEGNYIWVKIVGAGYIPYLQLGENLAIEFSDTESLVSAWMNSPTHRANLLNEGFRDQGMGVTFGNSGQGQYHSAIANTFGTLLVKKAVALPEPLPAPAQNPPAAPPAAPKPTPKPAPLPPKPAPATPPGPTAPVAIPAPSGPATTTTGPSNQSPGFSLPLNVRGGTSTLAGQTPAGQGAAEPPSAPNKPNSQTLNLPVVASPAQSAKNNRYFSLVFGILLLLFLLTDLKSAVSKEIHAVDKKINNLAVLFIAIVVIAVMYWL